ncbi:MAG: DUF4446 family protein [Candidatus Paceibacterota bacterium]
MENILSINGELLLSVLAGLVFIVLLWNIRLEIKVRRLLSGKNAQSLEDTIIHIHEGHDTLFAFKKDVERYLEQAEKRLNRSIQGVETIRFNPFKGIGAGGNQSFSTAFLNEAGNGVIISTLYARDRMSFFSKPVVNFASSHELTEEERETIVKAKASMKLGK